MARALCLIVLLTTAVRIDAAQRGADSARPDVPASGAYQAAFKALYSGDTDAAGTDSPMRA